MTDFKIDMDEARRDMAAIFRWSAREGLHEGIATIFHVPYLMMARCF